MENVVFTSGAKRSSAQGRGRPDLLPGDALLRVSRHYERGVPVYGERNWEKGIPRARCQASLFRHLLQYLATDRTEDHLSAIVFNALALITYEERGIDVSDTPVPTRSQESGIRSQESGTCDPDP